MHSRNLTTEGVSSATLLGVSLVNAAWFNTQALSPPREDNSESGQALLFLLLVLSFVMCAVAGLAVDFSGLWTHRQMAQAAADAACSAGAMDLLLQSTGVPSASGSYVLPAQGDCANSASSSICAYARLNGYSGSGLNSDAASSAVSWSSPAAVAGLSVPPSSIAPHPYLETLVQEYVLTPFSGIATGSKYRLVSASAVCGLRSMRSIAPITVLHPSMAGALQISGAARLVVVGGASRAIQVNSNNPSAVLSEGGLVDLSGAGPAGTGAEAGIFGGPRTAPSGNFSPGSTGAWIGPAMPLADPFSGLPTPTRPSLSPTATSPEVAAYPSDGCPDKAPTNKSQGCLEYEPGYYPNGITLSGNDVAIFKPGLYYMDGSLQIGGSYMIRMAKPCVPSCSPSSATSWRPGDGMVLYFHRGSLILSGSAGTPQSSRIDPVDFSDLMCDGSAPPSALGLPQKIDGIALMGQCTLNGTYFDPAGDTQDQRGAPGMRGLLLFADPGNPSSPVLGDGAPVLAGSIYLHSFDFHQQFALSSSTAQPTFVLGSIVIDRLSLTGNSQLSVALGNQPNNTVLKAGLFQ